MAGNRLTSGVTPWLVHRALVSAVKESGILKPGAIWRCYDDETLPKQIGPHQQFITIKLPNFMWDHGDAFYGGSDGENGTTRLPSMAEFILAGRTRITLWLNNDSDLFGTVDSLEAEAHKPPPGAAALLDSLVNLFWEQDLMNVSPWVTKFNAIPAGDYLLKRCMRFVSYEPPAPGNNQDWRPFRLTWELTFTWDTTVTG